MKRRTILTAIHAIGLGLALGAGAHLTACSGRTSQEPQPAGPASRVISTSPNLTEILFAVGAAEQTVGVTDFCTYPPGAREIQRIGAYLNPDVERMIALQPDLVLLLPSMVGLRDRLHGAGIPTLTVANESLDQVLESIDAIGEATGHAAEAVERRSELVTELEAIAAAVAQHDPVSTLVVIGRGSDDLTGIFAVGPGTFLDELLRNAGGRNVLVDAVSLYPQVPLEEVIRLAPEVIIEVVVPPSELAPEEIVASWSALSTVPAVRDERIHVLTNDYLLIPGPRSVRTARQLQVVLHPLPGTEP
jgi:iron complex transport system substrate-binding protein